MRSAICRHFLRRIVLTRCRELPSPRLCRGGCKTSLQEQASKRSIPAPRLQYTINVRVYWRMNFCGMARNWPGCGQPGIRIRVWVRYYGPALEISERSSIHLRILWVKAGKLLPVDTGGKIRSYNIVRHLARAHTVTLLSYYGGKKDRSYEDQIRRELPGAPFRRQQVHSPRSSASCFFFDRCRQLRRCGLRLSLRVVEFPRASDNA